MAQVPKNKIFRKYPNLRIAYVGIKAGNMDERFGSNASCQLNRQRFYKKIASNKCRAATIKALGGSKFIDLDTVSSDLQIENFSCDGLITTQPGQILALFPADCIPLVIYCVNKSVLALIHIGRQNATSGFHLQALEYICNKYKITPDQLLIYLGLSIKQKSYLFHSIEKNQAQDTKWKQHIKYKKERFYIDLPGYVKEDIIKFGVTKDHIVVSSIDTGGNKKYFSHRRSSETGEPEGRNGFAAVIDQ